MIHNKLVLREQFPDVTLTSYVCALNTNARHDPRPAIVICPGGGYSDLSSLEAEPIARQYLAVGYNVFILRYSVGQNAADHNPLIEVAMAVKYVREHAEAHHTDPNRIFTCGFSSGGHLAASAGVLWNHPAIREALGIESGIVPEGINRPNGIILCYPVITSAPCGHRNSFKRLCGKSDPTDEETAEFSLELRVDETTPPAFIWHTAADRGVSVRNSLMLANALIEHGHRPELHIFPDGDHGLGLGTPETSGGNPRLVVPHVTPWMKLSIAWIEDTFQK